MRVKYALFNNVNVKYLADLKLSFWRKNSAFIFLNLYILPFKKCSIKNILNLQVRDILKYMVLITLLPFFPVLIEVFARTELARYTRLSKEQDDVYVSDFEVHYFTIPKEWNDPVRYTSAD